MLYVLNPRGSKLRLFKNLVWNNEIGKIVYMSARDIKKSFAEDKLSWKNIETKSSRRFIVRDCSTTTKYIEPVKMCDYPSATLVPFGYDLYISINGKMYKNCTVNGGTSLETRMPVMYINDSLCIFDKKDGFVPILLN